MTTTAGTDRHWDAACLAHLCTPGERDTFERDGFLMVPGALDDARLRKLLDAAGRADDEFRAEPGIGKHHVLNQHDLIGRDDVYLDLVDLPTTFTKVWGVLGWHIQCFHTQLIVTPPTHPGAAAPESRWASSPTAPSR